MKLSPFADGVISYINLQILQQKYLELANGFNIIAGYKSKVPKSIILPYANSEESQI